MIAHILKLKGLQNELHLMDNLIANEDFVMIITTLLPKSWDHFTGLFLGARGSMSMITSQELILLLLDEDQRKKERAGNSAGTMLLTNRKDKHACNKDKECYNCKKKGHITLECWEKGGGKEGQGPGRKTGCIKQKK